MNKDILERNLLEAVKEYIDGEETFGDNATVCINPQSGEVEIHDMEDTPDNMDSYDIMEFIAVNPLNPAEWIVDTNAVESVVAEY